MQNRIFKTRLSILTGFLLCFGAMGVGQAAEKFSVASVNILDENSYLNHGPKNRLSTEKRLTAFKSFLNDYCSSIDICFFYEWPSDKNKSYMKEWKNSLNEWLQNEKKSNHDYYIYKPYERNKTSQIIAIVRKNKFTSFRVLPYKNPPLGTYTGNAVAVIIQPKNITRKLAVIGCHFQGGSGGKVGYHEFRRKQFKKVMTFKSNLKVDGSIICGDLNWDTKGNIQTYNKEILHKDAFNTKMWKNINSNIVDPTNLTFIKNGSKSVQKCLDYMFVEKKNFLKNTKFMTTPNTGLLLNSLSDDKSAWFSDHKALIGWFTIK